MSGTVTVTPAEFVMVSFDAASIADIAEHLLEQLHLAGLPVRIEVDETSPLARNSTVSIDPLVLAADSGAFEDPKRLRHLSAHNTADVIGRFLLHYRDRQGLFADAPGDAALTLAQKAAWDVYSNGRLERLGHPQQRQRWLYHFRNRHGFTDSSDAVFARLWSSDGLTWAELSALSDEALASRQPVA